MFSDFKAKAAKFLNLFLVFSLLLVSGFGCQGGTTNAEIQKKTQPITLNYWRAFDDEDAFKDIISDYQKIHPNITIVYRKFRPEEYEQALVDAFAEDRGPDIFSIPENQINRYLPKLMAMPATVKMAYTVTQGTFQKKSVTQIRQTPTLSPRQVKELYPDVVGKNVIINNSIYGLPLSLESLIMLYNKDILNQSGVTEVPTDWQTLNAAVEKMTRFDATGKILQSGVAMGTGTNINHAMAILSVLMLQSGSPMTDDQGLPKMFQNTDTEKDPDLTALNFYKAFASPDKSVYTWNLQMPFSLNAFMAGSVGFIFGYNYNIPTIRAQAPKLNLGVAPIPQLNPGTPDNYADYALEVVSKKSQYSDEAWDFLLFASSAKEVATQKNKEVEKFLNLTKRPAALRSLINTQAEDGDLHAAATQTLTATDWYQGKDFVTAEKAFDDMLDQIQTSADSSQLRTTLQTGINKISQTY